MSLDFSVLTSHRAEILAGLRLTLTMWAGASAMAMALGLVIAASQRYLGPAARTPVRLYVTIFRGTPLLIQLFLLYYGGPSFGLVLSPVAAGLIGLTIYGSAQFAEIFRSGFESIPVGQIEAAQMSGIGAFDTMRHIEIPQLLLIILPSLFNTLVVMTKETAILSVIAIPDLTAILSGIGSETFAYAETLFTLAAFYWILLEVLTTVGRALERRFGRHLAR